MVDLAGDRFLQVIASSFRRRQKEGERVDVWRFKGRTRESYREREGMKGRERKRERERDREIWRGRVRETGEKETDSVWNNNGKTRETDIDLSPLQRQQADMPCQSLCGRLVTS